MLMVESHTEPVDGELGSPGSRAHHLHSTQTALVDLGNAEGFASLQAPGAWPDGAGRRRDVVDIHRWEQLIHSIRTQVTSLHHNVSAALAETFITPWRPSAGGEPVWLLGRCYEPGIEDPDDAFVWPEEGGSPSSAASSPGRPGQRPRPGRPAPRLAAGALDARGSPEEFEDTWSQIMRMTYRKGFAPMYREVRKAPAGTDEKAQYIRLTSDAGWGCMIRVGQMLLATALKRHMQRRVALPDGPKAHVGSDLEHDRLRGALVLHAPTSLEHKFLDDPCPDRSPFSIFAFIRAAYGREVTGPPRGSVDAEDISDDPTGTCHGARPANFGRRVLTEKKPGDWFGPTTVSQTISALVEAHEDFGESMAVYVDTDGVLYEDEVRALALGVALEVASFSPEGKPPKGRQEVEQEAARERRSSKHLPSEQPERSSGNTTADPLDDEFELISIATVSSSSPWASPMLTTLQAETEGSPHPSASATGDGQFEETQGADVMQVGSFMELKGIPASPEQQLVQSPSPQANAIPDPDFDCGEYGELLPPPAVPVNETPRWKRAVLLLFPLQLGIEKYVGESHISSVLQYFELQSSLGAMGGRPRMAHFFVGRQGKGLLYVDPHVVQPAAVTPCSEEEDDSNETFRNVPTAQVIPVEHIDSSISFAFYVRDEADLTELISGIRRVEVAQLDAPIRAEKTRPASLRPLNGSWRCPQGAATWCNVESDLGRSFTELERRSYDADDFRNTSSCASGSDGDFQPSAADSGAASSRAAPSSGAFASGAACGAAASGYVGVGMLAGKVAARSGTARGAAPGPRYSPTGYVSAAGGQEPHMVHAAASQAGVASGSGRSNARPRQAGSTSRTLSVGMPWAMIESQVALCDARPPR